MIGGGLSSGLGSSSGGFDLGGKSIGPNGVIVPAQSSTPPREGSRDIDEGIIISEVPDWCKSPETPIPYTIWARQTDSANLVDNVRQTSERSHAQQSIVLYCHGDEGGTGGGVISGTHNAECTPKNWSQTVFANRRNMVRHDDEWWMNHKNTWGRLYYLKGDSSYRTPEVKHVEPRLFLAQAAPEPAPAEAAPPLMEEPVRPEEPPYEPPPDATNDNQPPNPEAPIEPPGKIDPLAGSRSLFIPDPNTVPLTDTNLNKLSVRRRTKNPCDCLIGQYLAIQKECTEVCAGKTHHIAPDMIYRLGARPRTAAEMNSTENRIKGGLGEPYPTYNQGMSVCLSADDHSSGPDGIHSDLRGAFQIMSAESSVPGTAPLGSIFAASKRSIRNLQGLSAQCKKDVGKALDAQTRLFPTSQPGRVQESLPLSPQADQVLRQGRY